MRVSLGMQVHTDTMLVMDFCHCPVWKCLAYFSLDFCCVHRYVHM